MNPYLFLNTCASFFETSKKTYFIQPNLTFCYFSFGLMTPNLVCCNKSCWLQRPVMLHFNHDTFGSSYNTASNRGVNAGGVGRLRECIRCKHRAKRPADNAWCHRQTGNRNSGTRLHSPTATYDYQPPKAGTIRCFE